LLAALACGCGRHGGSAGGAAAPSGSTPPAPLPPWVAADLGGAPLSEPSVVGDGARRFVFFQGQNGDLWLASRDVAAPWAAPADLGVAIASAPSAIATGIDAIRVFYRAANGDLSYVDLAGAQPGAPVDLGGVALASAPAAVRRGDSKYAVCYAGPGGHLFVSRFDGGPAWSAPQDLGVPIASTPCAVVPYDAPDEIEVFFAAASGDLSLVAYDGVSWAAAQDLGLGPLASPPAATSFAAGRTDVFYASAGGELEHVALRRGLAPGAPEGLGAILASGPSARDELEVYFRAPNGHLAAAAPPQPVAFPAFGEVYGVASHNAYWIARGDPIADPLGSGTQELLLDQLLHEHVRSIELDVHTDDGNPGVWTIYHTDRTDYSQVHTLGDALDFLRDFHYALPEHEAIVVVIELKNTNINPADFPVTEETFLPDHTIAQFDQNFRDALGDALFTPRDLLARCEPGSTVTRSAAVGAWPTIDRLRGKFIIDVMGSWSNAVLDWARYAAEGNGIVDRVAFPIRSIFDVQGNGVIGTWPGDAVDPYPPQWLQAARDASAFWDVEDYNFPGVPLYLAQNGIVRSADSYDAPAQIDALARGFRMILTDYPWNIVADGGPAGSGIPTDPSRRFRDPSTITATGRPAIAPEALIEPGIRFYASTDAQKRLAYSVAPPGGVRRWETLVSTTRIGDTVGTSFPRRAQEGGVGGIEAAAGRDDFIEVARVKTGASCNCMDQERLAVHVGVSHGGVYAGTDFPVTPFGADIYGSLIALEVDETGPVTVARAYSAGRIAASGAPDWRLLVEERFGRPLAFQGITFNKDVLFVGTKVADAGQAPRPVTLCDLASIDGGAGATLVDLSFPAAARTCTPTAAPLP
jgi:hypothetical protein